MAREIRQKATFGSVNIDHFSPPAGDGLPRAINIHVSFEDALKLHLGLGQLLAHLNRYNRATRAGRQTGVNLCVYTDKLRITINESRGIGGRNETPDENGE